MPGGIGFYVHHHGRGHAQRVGHMVPFIASPVTIFGSSVDALQHLASEQVRITELPGDTDSGPLAYDWPNVLHYAPLGIAGITQRMNMMTAWMAETSPALLVVDVSVEVTLLARLCSIPTVVVRQHGIRDDPAHQAAFQSARGLLAPYSEALEDDSTPAWVRDKTFYAGGFSRYQSKTLRTADARQQLGMQEGRYYIVVINGFGGNTDFVPTIAQAALHHPDWEWWVVGPSPPLPPALPHNMKVVGPVSDTYPYLRGADMVVASAGNNTVMEIATTATTGAVQYVCIPEERPFQEQVQKAAALRRLNAALVLDQWPPPHAWKMIQQDLTQIDTAILPQLITQHGAQRAATYLERMSE